MKVMKQFLRSSRKEKGFEEKREREVCSVMEKVNKFLTSICQTQLVVFFFQAKKENARTPI